MNKVQDNPVQAAPTEPPSPLGNADDEDLDDTFVLELVNGCRGNSVNLVVNGGFKFSSRKADRFPQVTLNCLKFKCNNLVQFTQFDCIS